MGKIGRSCGFQHVKWGRRVWLALAVWPAIAGAQMQSVGNRGCECADTISESKSVRVVPLPFGPGVGQLGLLPVDAADALMEIKLPLLADPTLTEAQQDRIFDLAHEAAPLLRKYARALHKAREDLEQLTHDDVNYDEARVAALARAAADAAEKLAVLRARVGHDIEALLTPDQRHRERERMGLLPRGCAGPPKP